MGVAPTAYRFLSKTDGARKSDLIAIIDKENSLGRKYWPHPMGTSDGKFNKYRDFEIRFKILQIRVKI